MLCICWSGKKTVQNALYVHQNTRNLIFVELVIFLDFAVNTETDITTSGVTKSVEELLKQGKHIPMSMSMTSFAALSRIVLYKPKHTITVTFGLRLSFSCRQVLIFQCPCPVQITNVTEIFDLHAFSTTDRTTSSIRV